MFEKSQSYNIQNERSKADLTDSIEFDSFKQFNAHDNLTFDSKCDSELFKSRSKCLSNPDEVIHFKNGEITSLNQCNVIEHELETVIKWENLEVEVNVKGQMKKILHNVNGEINNLQIMAILGPSGAGKTTFLNLIAGRIKNYNGSVSFYSKHKKLTFAYVPQVDILAQYLTIKESLLFASKLKNPPGTNHEEEVNKVINAFNLSKCKNHYARVCSGGERKRLSIGLEMISKPSILILDEMTTGLDSTTAYQVVETLKTVNKNTTIITTIHQPNSRLFRLFDRCYVLTDGFCIYNGTPQTLVNHLKEKFDILIPKFTNPADFILEIANNIKTKEGREIIKRLAKDEQDESTRIQELNITKSTRDGFRIFLDPESSKEIELPEIDRSSFKRKKHFFREYFLNVHKLLVSLLRDPQQTLLRTINNVNFPIVLYLISNRTLGEESGCSFLPLNETHILTENLYERNDRQLKGNTDAGSAFINLMFTFFSSLLPAVFALTDHVKLAKKEYINSYYSVNTFYLSIITVNIFLSLFYATANTISFFLFTKQILETYRILTFWFIIFLSCTIGDIFGLELSILFPNNYITAIVTGGFGAFALETLSGFFISIDTMTTVLQKISTVIFCRHTFEATMRTLYGYRCKIEDHMIFEFDSLIEFIKYYNYENGENLQDISEMPLKVKNALREKQWNRSEIMEMAETINELDSNEMEKLNYFWSYRTNYLLDSYDLNDPDPTMNLIVIVITLMLFFLLGYFSLLYRLKK